MAEETEPRTQIKGRSVEAVILQRVSGEMPKPQSCNQAMNFSEVQGHFSWEV